jgi:hypothetical protein
MEVTSAINIDDLHRAQRTQEVIALEVINEEGRKSCMRFRVKEARQGVATLREVDGQREYTLSLVRPYQLFRLKSPTPAPHG